MSFDRSENGFNAVANSYTSFVPQLPLQYIDLIQTTFKVKGDDRIIDLGCGSGLLTFGLRTLSHEVLGLDKSTEMIRIAKQRDINSTITWICKPLQDFDFEKGAYSLIISFESFHLFPKQLLLIKRCYKGLKTYGTLCIGWCQHHWEELFRPIIIDTFASFGIYWGEWEYQSCSHFSNLLKESNLPFSPLKTKSVIVPTKSSIHSVAQYLTCIDKSLVLSGDERAILAKSLEQKFLAVTTSDYATGDSIYYINYTHRPI